MEKQEYKHNLDMEKKAVNARREWANSKKEN
jgi:hypothetical protein